MATEPSEPKTPYKGGPKTEEGRQRSLAQLTNAGRGRPAGSRNRPKKKESINDMVFEAVLAKGGKDWLLTLDDKTFAAAAMKLIERKMDDDAAVIEHEQWISHLESKG